MRDVEESTDSKSSVNHGRTESGDSEDAEMAEVTVELEDSEDAETSWSDI